MEDRNGWKKFSIMWRWWVPIFFFFGFLLIMILNLVPNSSFNIESTYIGSRPHPGWYVCLNPFTTPLHKRIFDFKLKLTNQVTLHRTNGQHKLNWTQTTLAHDIEHVLKAMGTRFEFLRKVEPWKNLIWRIGFNFFLFQVAFKLSYSTYKNTSEV
jgi:hypothetical protein